MKTAKKQVKRQNKIKSFLGSFHLVLTMLIILIIILIIYCNYLLKSAKTYMFNGTGEYVTVYNGIISLNYNVNVFEGSDIEYIKEKDIVVTKYTMGYYVKDKDNLVSLAVVEDEDENGLSLKSLIEGISVFNLTELNNNKRYFTKDSKKLIDDGLYFVIEATTKDGENITNITEMEITKLSK